MAKKSDALFHLPKKGERCVRFTKNFAGRGETSKEDFHKDSFRWTRESDRGKGPSYVMVGCPKKTRGRAKASKIGEKNIRRFKETIWNPRAPLGEQCRYKDGTKAGLRGHKIVQPMRGGKCRPGYSVE